MSDTPPPLSGGSKLNNSTCGVEKKNGHPRTRHYYYLLSHYCVVGASFFSLPTTVS